MISRILKKLNYKIKFIFKNQSNYEKKTFNKYKDAIISMNLITFKRYCWASGTHKLLILTNFFKKITY